jgi:hypothetical protein
MFLLMFVSPAKAPDHARERDTRVDFVGGTRVETPGAFAATLQRFLAK